ncbi:MAG: glycosyltransferase family 4 protein [Thermodesulfobacteriota bacterium]
MRVLVLDEEVFLPPETGKRIRTGQLLRHLAKRHEIVFACRYHEETGPPRPNALEELGIRLVSVDHPVRRKKGLLFAAALMAGLLSRHPYSVASHKSLAMKGRVAEELAQAPFDLVHCEWTPYIENLPAGPAPALCLSAHNVESQVWERMAAAETNPLKKAFLFLQYKRWFAFEKAIIPRFDAVCAVSENDRETFSRWTASEKVFLVENGVDGEYFAPAGPEPVRPLSLVFSGSMDWRPNVDAALWFLEKIFPLIRKRYPEATFTIAGRRPDPALREAAGRSKGVLVTGTVEDMRPFLAAAQVIVVPLRSGGGSRLKILEALSMQKPVVSTAVGAEGLRVTDGKDILLADRPQDFADAVMRLFSDASECRSLGENGRGLVQESYRWQALAGEMEKAWEHAASAGGRSARR